MTINSARFVLLACALVLPSPTLADYPIFYQRYTAAPASLVWGGRLYLYASHDLDEQTAYAMTDVTCLSTDDLKNWTDHGECFGVSSGSSWAQYAWAPAVVQRDGRFFMYYANAGSGIGVAVSDGPTGPFRDPRSSALIDAATPGVDPPSGMRISDPAALVDDDGRAYLYFGGNGASNIRVIELKPDMISTAGPAVSLTAPRFFQGNFVHKYGGRYHLSYSTDWSAGAPTIDYMTSASPTSGFERVGTVLPQPPDNDNNTQHAIFEYQGAWYLAYHNRALARLDGVDPVYHRNLGLERLSYASDGAMNEVAFTSDGVPQLKPLDPYARVEAETMRREHGIETEASADGGRKVSSVENGDWIEIAGVDFATGAATFEARVASATGGGVIELRLDRTSGTLIGSCAVPGTGGWQAWTTASCAVTGATGVHDLYLLFTGGSGRLFDVDWWRFHAAARADTTPPTAPGAPIVSDVTSSGLTLSWAPSTDDVGVTGYVAYERTSAGDVDVATASTVTVSLTGLAPSTTHTYTVKARDAAGNVSAASADTTVTTLPADSGSTSSSSGSTSSSSGSTSSSSGSTSSSSGSTSSSSGSTSSSGGSTSSSGGSTSSSGGSTSSSSGSTSSSSGSTSSSSGSTSSSSGSTSSSSGSTSSSSGSTSGSSGSTSGSSGSTSGSSGSTSGGSGSTSSSSGSTSGGSSSPRDNRGGFSVGCSTGGGGFGLLSLVAVAARLRRRRSLG